MTNEKNNYFLFKRIFDVVFSIFAIVIFMPILILIFLLIHIFSPGAPAIFKQERVGKNGNIFFMYKFRTMVPNAEEILEKWLKENQDIKKEYEEFSKIKDDPRIIPIIGNFLRKSSLDELPQFFNTLIGDMSTVGPRPVTKREIEKYKQFKELVVSIKPGITGLWQVSGRNELNFNERVYLDIKYIKEQSFTLDIKIIFKTIIVIFFKEGAY